MDVVFNKIESLTTWLDKKGDPRVKDWLLLSSPIPIAVIFILYLTTIKLGPKLMKNREAFDLKMIILPYNFCLVLLSLYMVYEFFMSAYLAGYSLVCQPVDYSNNPLALRMASVCWWFFFSKVIELADTVFFIMRKKSNQVTFLHVFHHCTMIINWWLGAKYIAGGQSFFLALLNSFVHVIMYSYYTLAALGPHMQKYLWWKKYMTSLQLTQFVLVIIHTGVNMASDCNFPLGFNIAVFSYASFLISLFGNFYYQSYIVKGERQQKKSSSGEQNGHSDISQKQNGYYDVSHEQNNYHKNGNATQRKVNKL